jgi:hypothetical protein
MSITTTISLADGSQAAVNLSNGAVAYCTPGNSLTVALQTTTGVQEWDCWVNSDYPNLNAFNFKTSGPTFSFQFPAPQQPCTLKINSVCSDGTNKSESFNTVYNYPRQTGMVRGVRYVCTANVNTASCNVVQDGVTGVAGDRILLTAQTTASQNGPWVVGAVAANLAALSRPGDFLSAQVLSTAPAFEVTEGTLWANSDWKFLGTLNANGNYLTVDTSSMTLYPRIFKKTITLLNGVYTVGAGGGGEALFMFANTCSIQLTQNTAAGTMGTGKFAAPVANRTVGVAGTAAALVLSLLDNATNAATDNSTVDFMLVNY